MLIQEEFIEVQKKYADYTHFYANGAKTSTFAGSGLYSDDFAQAERLSCVESIFTAELYGAFLALQYIATTKVIKALLFEDFQSVAALLCSLGDTKNKPVKLVQHKINSCLEFGPAIRFRWFPSHVFITGNERADQLASSANNLQENPHGIPFLDVKSLARKALFCLWQSEWNLEDTNKLHLVEPILGLWENSSHKDCFCEVLWCRLRIGHTFLTHIYLLCGDDPPECDHCG